MALSNLTASRLLPTVLQAANDSTMETAARALVRRLLETLEDAPQAAQVAQVDGLYARLLSAPEPVQLAAENTRIALSHWQERLAKRLMIERLDQNLSVTEIAYACSLSRSHFSRAFKKNTGVSPRHWYQQARIEKAKQMLAETKESISQIGIQCGFSDQSHFTRVFTRTVGQTPFNWRRIQPSVHAETMLR
jgi:transcriptional regulator GlxA family with amidase domain